MSISQKLTLRNISSKLVAQYLFVEFVQVEQRKAEMLERENHKYVNLSRYSVVA